MVLGAKHFVYTHPHLIRPEDHSPQCSDGRSLPREGLSVACTALRHVEERLIFGSALIALGLSYRASALFLIALVLDAVELS